MKITVLDAATLGGDMDLGVFTSLGECELWQSTEPEQVADRLKTSDVAVLNKIKLNESNLKEAKSLKLICVAATGFDNIDTDYCLKAGIALCNVPGYSTPSVCQLTVSMALYLATHLGEYRDYVNSGEYTRSGVANRLVPVYHEISGKTWGIVGGGAIGSAVAKCAEAMGARVIVCRRKKESRYPAADIDTLCREADIISLHTPLNQSTENLISRRRIAMMKDGVMLINTARGAVCDEAALADAVISKKIGALGVDVYSKEPMSGDHPFNRIKHMENVCLTPHMAWGSYEARCRCIETVAQNIRSFFAGESQNRVV